MESGRRLAAEWIVAEKLLGELVLNNFSKESYEFYSVTDIFAGIDGECRISWETWKRYYTENLNDALSRLKTSTEYKDVNGIIISLSKEEIQEDQIYKLDRLEYKLDKNSKKERDEKVIIQLRTDCLQFIATRQEDHATEYIVDSIESINFIYTTRDDIKSEIWFYDCGIYKPNGESYIKEYVRKVLLHAYTPQRANKVIAKIEADTMIDANKFFNINYIDEVPILNGILNIRTRVVSPFDPKKIFFSKLPLTYDKEATCGVIEKFFMDILKEAGDVEVAFELFGYCLLKDHPIEKAFMFVGEGRNGKGKFISLLKTFLGAENCCSVPLNQLRSDSTSVCELFGKMANLAGDLNNTALKETGLFKEITGRDMVGAKRKYLRDLFFTNYSKQIFACNELPRVYDFKEGFWSRWVLLEFPNRFIEQREYDLLGEDKGNAKIRDTEIIDKLTEDSEMSGLLNIALDGLDRVRRQKDISSSRGTSETKNFWIRNSDSFSAFCLDMLEDDYEGYVSKKKLRSEFMKYCKLHRIKGASDKGMKAVLEDMFGSIEGRKSVSGVQEYVWEGVCFKEIS